LSIGFIDVPEAFASPMTASAYAATCAHVDDAARSWNGGNWRSHVVDGQTPLDASPVMIPWPFLLCQNPMVRAPQPYPGGFDGIVVVVASVVVVVEVVVDVVVVDASVVVVVGAVVVVDASVVVVVGAVVVVVGPSQPTPPQCWNVVSKRPRNSRAGAVFSWIVGGSAPVTTSNCAASQPRRKVTTVVPASSRWTGLDAASVWGQTIPPPGIR
jgi:hypothetical protein